MNIIMGRPCWEKITALWKSVIQKKTLPIMLWHILTEWAAGRQSTIILHVISFFGWSISSFYGLVLTIFWLRLFKRVHQRANCFQHKDNLSHLLSEMENAPQKMTWLRRDQGWNRRCREGEMKDGTFTELSIQLNIKICNQTLCNTQMNMSRTGIK